MKPSTIKEVHGITKKYKTYSCSFVFVFVFEDSVFMSTCCIVKDDPEDSVIGENKRKHINQ